ncbi:MULTISPECIES: GNAT family N-acetyltransferase [unclassified Modestobacter]|uniref:GNAT family N-acetyltransferase n=1 Tax=unclassified Modestobacter TaxID=2643866 RepID=UPI0022AA1C1E|nr:MULTISPECIES: GNAT family N-acetyltransferase [unclassified Modestobacter]MCZ2824062.1 GNAT family N-acetyltransferase [Modestobacter sp. VKM Ac-2981]MCZ2852307.1 GNAT family N-acetyltransferase [Modestobacter sp. VKM Ac-2982]
MSTSAEAPGAASGPARLRVVGYADPVAQHLIERVQQEYVVRYGGRDAAVVDPGEFSPPLGLFLVAEVDGVPAGCGGWRAHGQGVAELKRMYVEPGFRRRGLAGQVLVELERTAAAAGAVRLLLNSGDRQPEALALYARAGYTPAAGYGIYADSPEAVFLGKELIAVRPVAEEDAWAS